MTDLDELKNAVQQSTELWISGKGREALATLDALITKAKQENREVWVKVLAMHASTLADSVGDRESARRYCEEVLLSEPENALALFKVADILLKQGKGDEARRYAQKSYALAAASDTKDGQGLAELLAKKWPEVGGRT
jgi:tetratricopeptide (TPR) repeat protein